MSIAEPIVRNETLLERDYPLDPDASRSDCEPADGELLRRFTAHGDEMAFARLVSRHAAIVMGVCRRALGSEQDAEDAFQATFLVLARKAATVRKATSLSAWLYKTAYRIALQARAKRARRKEETLEVETMTTTDTFANIASEHEQAMLDEEFNRLPEKYRLPLFLCCVEGKSRDEAADQLGISEGAVKGRLERGRQLLRRRLVLRGLTFSVATGVLVGLQQTAQATQVVTSPLISSTVQGGIQYASGEAALGFVSQNAVSLANANLQVFSFATLKTVACILIAISILASAESVLPVSETTRVDELMVHTDTAEEPVSVTLTLVSGRETGETAEMKDDVPLPAMARARKKGRCCKKAKGNVAKASTTNDESDGPTPTLAPTQHLEQSKLVSGSQFPNHENTQRKLVSILRNKDDS